MPASWKDEALLQSLLDIDLSRVAVTAALSEDGDLEPVRGVLPKLAAAGAHHAEALDLLDAILVARDQVGVPATRRLPVRTAGTLQEAVQVLARSAAPRKAVREQVRAECRGLELFPGLQVPLGDVYQEVPFLREVSRQHLPAGKWLSAQDVLGWEESLVGAQVRYAPVAPDRVLARHPRLLLLGPPGSGKSSLTRHLARREVAGRSSRIPARVVLREWQDAGVEMLEAHLAARHPGTDPSDWSGWREDGRVWLLLDGVDEVEESFLPTLRRLLHEPAWRKCPALLTCRTVSAGRHARIAPDLPVFTLAGLGAIQQDAFVHAWHRHASPSWAPEDLLARLRGLPGIRPLARNPLLLGLLCFAAAEARPLSGRRSELYDLAVQGLLLRHGDPGLEPLRARRIVERVALRFLEDHRLLFGRDRLLAALDAAARAEGYGQEAARVTDALLRHLPETGLLAGDPGRGYSFVHRTVHEFLAGCQLAREARRPATLLRRAWSPDWEEPLLFMAGRLARPRPFLRRLAAADQDDLFRHRLALAVRARAETGAGASPAASRTLFDLWWSHRRRGFSFAHLDQAVAASPEALNQVESLLGHAEGRHRLEAVRGVSRLGPTASGTVAALCVCAADPEWPVRHAAVEALGVLGQPRTLECLLARLEDPVPEVRLAAVRALGGLGERAATAEVRTALLALSESPAVPVRRTAIEALGRCFRNSPDPTILEALRSALRDPEWLVRLSAVESLAELGCAPAPLLESLHDPEEPVHYAARQALRTRGHGPEMLESLIEMLSHPEARLRRAAVEGLEDLGFAIAAGRPVMALLHHPERAVRRSAEAVLAGWGAAAATASVLGGLRDMLRGSERALRARAARVLTRLGPAAANPEMVEALLEALRLGTGAAAEALVALADPDDLLDRLVLLLQDPSASVRGAAVHVLGKLDPEVALPLLLERLDDPEWPVRCRAAEALAGTGARTVPPALRRRLDDPVQQVRHAAAAALGRLTPADPGQVRRTALAFLQSPESARRQVGAEVLRSMPPADVSSELVLALARMLRSRQPGDRLAAIRAVASLGPAGAAEEVLDALPALLRDRRVRVRDAALAAAGAVGRANAEIRVCLLGLLHHDSAEVKRDAAAAVRALGPEADGPGLFQALLSLCEDPAPRVRAGAAAALGTSASSRTGLQALRALFARLGDPEEAVRWASVQSLRQLAPDLRNPDQWRAVIRRLRSKDAMARWVAREMLDRLGPERDPALLAPLLAGMASRRPEVRDGCSEVLQRADPSALGPEPVGALLALLEHPGGAVRASAAECLSGLFRRGVRVFASGKRVQVLLAEDLCRGVAAPPRPPDWFSFLRPLWRRFRRRRSRPET